jgi:hypothetical protein
VLQQGQPESEGATAALLAGEPDIAAVTVYYLADEAQANTRPFNMPI